VALQQFAPIGFVPGSCTLPGTITDVRRLSRNSQGDFMKTILMQHEMTHTLEDRSGVKGLKLIRLKGYDPSWSLGGIREAPLDEAAEAKLQEVVSKMQTEFDIA
jgi:hypothetical protein